MKLKRLTIQGFKSFKDRTTIHFDEGITGIVGPNGCGKSNIVDALFWIMGEQSAKHLRGHSMKDVIFSGSAKYSPAAWAEATLVLDNIAGKHIHIGNKVANPAEIQLTRKLYRNGESEYRINDNICRLKDIQEVFMDTGAGAKSYSIIAQGEIHRLVNSKPEERRVMIEEVAGITKFKLRRRESIRKIENTEENLARLQDIAQEIEKNLHALEKQAEKAEKARQLKEKIQRNDLVIQSHKVHDLLKTLRECLTFLQESEVNLQAWKVEKQNIEIGLEEERISKQDQIEKLDELQSEYNEISKQLAASEEKLNSTCKSQTEREQQLELRQGELQELTEEVQERQKKLELLKTEAFSVEKSGQEVVDFEAVSDKVNFLKEELGQKEENFQDLKKVSEVKTKLVFEKEQELERTTSRMQEFAGQLQDITKEIDGLEKQFGGISSQLAHEREEVFGLEQRLADCVAVEAKAKIVLTEVKRKTEDQEKTLHRVREQAMKVEGRLHSLEELQNGLEGLSGGSAAFLGTHKNGGFKLLGQLINSNGDHANAAQALLGQLVETVVGGNLDEVLAWTKENHDKRIDFLCQWPAQIRRPSEELKARLTLNGLRGLLTISDIIQAEPEVVAGLQSLLGECYLVENLNEEIFNQLPKDLPFDYLVSYDGRFLVKKVAGTAIVRNSAHSLGINLIEQNDRIKSLRAEHETLSLELAETSTLLQTLQQDFEEQKNGYEKAVEQLSQVRQEHAAKKSAFDAKSAGMQTYTGRLSILKERKSEISKARLELIEREDLTSKEVVVLRDELRTIDADLERDRDIMEELRLTYEGERSDYLRLQAQANSWLERLKGLNGQIADVELQIEKQIKKREQLEQMTAQYQQDIETLEAQAMSIEEANKNTAMVLSDREEILSLMKDRLAELLLGMKEREDRARELGQKINKVDKEMVEHQMRLNKAVEEEAQLTKDNFEKYQIDLRECLGLFLQFTENEYAQLQDISSAFVMETEHGQQIIVKQPYEFHRRYGQDLKECSEKLRNYKSEMGRLGEINWQAIEDYQRQKMRFDFLKMQEDELKKSLEDLRQAIERIDQKCRERFKIAFDEVNQRFQRVFPIIFGGGNASLNIVGNPDDPDCGVEIFAQPPGKKMVNTSSMSGGEKALTAVALIFSIFLVKPSPFCLLDEVDAPLDDANVGRFNELLREMSGECQFILITHNKKTMELNDTLYGVTMQEAGVSKAVSVQLH